MSVTIQVPIPDDLIPILERKACEAGLNREEYIRVVVSRELSSIKGLDEVLGTFREQVSASGISDDELSALFTTAREEVHRNRP
jgi:hypothetical protein